MANNRYTNRRVIGNVLRAYREQRKARRVRMIRHFSSPNLTYPTESTYKLLKPQRHIWKHGDRYYKLAHEYYGDSQLWWVIAWFNKAPTESHLLHGQTVLIPFPLQTALSLLRDA